MAERKAARVLPEPVGAAISVWWPEWMTGQPRRWGGVGASKVSANQRWITGQKLFIDIGGSSILDMEGSLTAVQLIPHAALHNPCSSMPSSLQNALRSSRVSFRRAFGSFLLK